MKPGRKKIPLRMKLLSGTVQTHPERKINRDAPQAPLASLKAPGGMTKREKHHWDTLAPGLRDTGILTALDVPMFRMLCNSLALIDEADAAIRKDGLTQKTKLGNRATSPWFRIRAQAEKQAIRMMGEFGLSPSSRSRLKIELMEPPVVRPNPEDEAREAEIDARFFGPQKGA